MPSRIQLLFPFLLCLLASTGLEAQKVLGLPEAYHPPESPYTTRNANTFDTEAFWRDRSKERGWRIVVDRTGVTAFDQPGGKPVKGLAFGDGYYVDEYAGEWLHLIDAVPNKLKVPKGESISKIGWVQKDQVLLWYESLVNPRTRIHLKALLINKLDNINNIPCDNRELVRVYKHPQSNTRSDSSTIYNFFFVYKIVGNRYLLGNAPTLKRSDPRSNLLGWVDQERLAEWNTRVAVEPNFAREAFQERKGNSSLRVAGFKDQFKATHLQNNGAPEVGSISWQRDPVRADKEELSASDPMRLNEDLMRYPLLNVDQGEAKLDYFRSAVCDKVIINKGCDPTTGNLVFGSVDPIQAVKQREYLDRHQQASTNFNVFFVVEASSRMAGYKDIIAGLASSVKRGIERKQDNPQVRFGALTYRDLQSSSDPDQLIDYQNLTATTSTFQRFIQGMDFGEGNTNEALPVQNFGINQAINIANFNPYHTNIMIVLGTKGDFVQSRIAAATATPALKPDRSTITDALNKYKINLFGIQCVGGQTRSDREFANNLVGIIQDAANKNYSKNGRPDRLDPKVKKLLEDKGYIPTPPVIPNPSGSSEPTLRLRNGTVFGSVDRIMQADGRRTEEALTEMIGSKIGSIVENNIALSKEIEKWKTGELAPKGFTPQMVEIMEGYQRTGDQEINWLKEKYELYKEVFFAIQPKGAEYPTFSYVLFWTKEDLKTYQRVLNASLTRMGDAPMGERREYLQEAYCDLLDRFTGGGAKKCEDYTIDEIEKTVQGVKNEGVNFTGKKERIGDLTDRKVVSDSRIETIIGELTEVNNRLRKLLDDRNGDFTFTRNSSTFYWIKVSDLYF